MLMMMIQNAQMQQVVMNNTAQICRSSARPLLGGNQTKDNESDPEIYHHHHHCHRPAPYLACPSRPLPRASALTEETPATNLAPSPASAAPPPSLRNR
ncbi:hypothetical protein INR49_017885 [Caranx melampygus]|nr:hypothetical protein INR49_017885 [Caranx melampygus]